jgi:transcriptional regulator
MPKTRRQKMEEHLSRESHTVRSLGALFGLGIKDTESELKHVIRSVGKDRLVVEPACCEDCGFVFRDRRRLTAPSRCPHCRCERVSEPFFRFSPAR